MRQGFVLFIKYSNFAAGIVGKVRILFLIMNTAIYIDNAKVMSKGQVTIPQEIRRVLNVKSGDRVTFVVENGRVSVVNTALYAMKAFQSQMLEETISEDDIQALIDAERKG